LTANDATQKNAPRRKFCGRCGSPLGVEVAMQVDEAKKADILIRELVKRPDVLDHLLEAMAKIRGQDPLNV